MRPGYKITALLSFVALTLLSSCSPAPKLRVHDAVVILSPVDSNPSALYFTVLGGPQDVYLLSAVSTSAIRSEIHESAMDTETGAMTMTPHDRILIPAKGKVEFKRGGKHVMMWGINLIARRLGEMRIQFLFSNGDRIIVKAPVQEIDGTDPDEKKAYD